MRAYFKASYDEEFSFGLYLAYGEDSSVFEELLISVCPLIHRMVKHEVRGDHRNDISRLEGEALEVVYAVLDSQDVPTSHPRVFTTFLSTVIVRAVRDSRRRSTTQVFEFWRVGRMPPTGRIEGVEEFERQLYREQFKADVRQLARSRVRFLGDEKKACLFIIDCEIGLKKANPRLAKRMFRINSHRCMYFIRYARILIKSSVIELRKRECESRFVDSFGETS